MRTILAAMLVVAGVGVLGSGGSAAPVSGAALDRAASPASLLTQIRYHRWNGRLCYRKCYREYLIGHRVCRTYC
jgi:hypothetical protein